MAWFSRSIRTATTTSGFKLVSKRICQRSVPAAVAWQRATEMETVNSLLTDKSSLSGALGHGAAQDR